MARLEKIINDDIYKDKLNRCTTCIIYLVISKYIT